METDVDNNDRQSVGGCNVLNQIKVKII